MKDVNHETITGTLSWYKICLLNGYNYTGVKQKLLKRRKRENGSFSSRHTSQKLFTLTIHWSMANLVKNYHWIINFYTSSIQDERYCWKSGTKSKRRYVSRTATIRIGGTMVGWIYGMLFLSAKCPRTACRWENSLWKTVWRTIQRANSSNWSNGWISPDFNTRSIKTSSIWKERFTRNLSLVCIDLIARWIWKGDKYDCGYRGIGKDGRLRNLSSENQRERSIEITIGIFPEADGTAKLSGRDYEFREPTLTREQSVTTDRIKRWRWSPCRLLVGSNFICRHHSEPRVQLHVPKEEAFPFPLKHIDVTRSTHTDLDVMQEKRIGDYWNVDSNRNFSDSWKCFTKFTLLVEKPPNGRDCLKFKRLWDQIKYDLKYGAKLRKPRRIEKNKNGKARSQNSTMLDD